MKKPNLTFLQKVKDGRVRHVKGYSARTGGYWKFYGGEATAKRHAAAGYVEMPRTSPELGRPAVVTLSPLGEKYLAENSTSKELTAALNTLLRA